MYRTIVELKEMSSRGIKANKYKSPNPFCGIAIATTKNAMQELLNLETQEI